MRRPLLVGLFLLASCALASCAHAPAPVAPTLAPPAAPAQPPGTVSIRVERLAPGAGWAVTWRLPQPVREVRFERPGHGDRKRQWILSTPGLSIVSVDGLDRVVSSGAPFDSFSAVLVEYARKPEKDYQAFIPFQDGTVLVYTGALAVEAPTAEEPWRVDFELVPRKGEAVIVAGTVHAGAARWTSRGNGTYVAFGTPPVHDTPSGMAVVDGGMPAWLRDRTLSLAPQVFAHYASRTGWQLGQRPTFFLSYGTEPDPGALSFGGGTLEGVVQLDARMGSRFAAQEDPVVWERQARLLAHEAAHLWLDQQLRPADGVSPWLDEGGADAWALRALLDLGVVTRARFREIVSADVAECIRLLEDGPLSGAARDGRWAAIYRCGEVANLLTEAAGSRREPPWDLVQIWGRVFYNARDGRYDEAIWFDTLLSMTGGTRVADAVRRMLVAPDPSLGDEIPALLSRTDAWSDR
jgi:hypothetical protein